MIIRVTWRRFILAVVALAAGGLLFAWSGLFNVAASSGHWAITDWFLHWTMRKSVRTQALLASSGSAIDGAGLVSAAGLYDQSCTACHGAPGKRPLPVMQASTPPAPDLGHLGDKWTDAQLFWIIKHGVKFTGMPGWAARDRDDEIRRMVGFVRALQGMTPARYRALTQPEIPAPDPALARCAGCHGVDGKGRGQADMPVLGGQRADMLLAALRDYGSGRRPSAVMTNAVAPLNAEALQRAAFWYAGQSGLRPESTTATLIEKGVKARQIPACRSCHDAAGRKPYPILGGQKASYLAGRLRQWRIEEGNVDARLDQSTMAVIARRIPEADIEPLARALSGGR